MAEFDPDAFLAKDKEKKPGFDPDAFLAKTAPQPSAQSILGGTESSSSKVASRAALADTAINALSGTWDLAARVPATAYHYATGPKGETFGQAYERAAEEVARTAPIKPDLVGRTLGITNTPQYSGAIQRRVAEAIAPVIQQSVIQPVAEATGLPEGLVSDIGAIATIPLSGPAATGVKAVGRVAAPVVRGAADTAIGLGKVAMSPIETTKGVAGGLFNTTKAPGKAAAPWETASARMPIGETYIPAPVLEQYRAGKITAEQAQAQALPTSTLPQAALRKTEGMVPYAGQEMRAAGEQIGAQYRDPYKLGAELGADYLLGGVPTVLRAGSKLYDIGSKARAYGQLGEAGFTPLTAAEAAALKSGKPYPGGPVSGPVSPGSIPASIRAEAAARITPVAPQQPLLGYNPNPGQTPMPMPGPGRRVNIEGESFNLPYQIDLSNVQAARPKQTAPVAPVAPVAPAPRPISTLDALDVAKQEKLAKMLADMKAKKTAEDTAITAIVSGPVKPEPLVRPMESIESRAAITAEDRALAQKTPREQLDLTLKGAITQKGKIDKKLLDETVASLGLDPGDWSKLGIEWQSMSIKDARKAVAKYIGEQTGVRGSGSRGERDSTRMARANKALEAENASKTPEQLAKEKADIDRRLRAIGNKYRPPSRGE